MPPPNQAYYLCCQGTWQSPLRLELRALSYIALPRWFGLRMQTQVVCKLRQARPEVVHTTCITWLSIPLWHSEEIFALDDNGRDFNIRGKLYWPTLGRPQAIRGQGSVDADAAQARYHFLFGPEKWKLGFRQQTILSGDVVEIVQDAGFVRSRQRLMRLT